MLDAVELPLGDVMISAEALPPKGLVLRNLVVSAPATHAEIMHDAGRTRSRCAPTLPLSLDWSVQLDDGSLYPLGTVHTEPLNVDIAVVARRRRRRRRRCRRPASAPAGRVDGVAKLSNGTVYLEAGADVTAAE